MPFAIAFRSALHLRLFRWAEGSRTRALAREFLLFGLRQAWASIFAAGMLAAILLSDWFYPASAPIARYDFLLIWAITLQAVMLATRLERWDEAAIVLVYHLVGTAMEVFKTAQGSWLYPEPSLVRIAGVPLFSGFMYAAVGSYMARILRIFAIRFTGYPPVWATWLLALLAYANFFTHHFGPDLRLGLFALSAIVFGRTRFHYRPAERYRSMPFLVGAVLVALFLWIAENLGTFGAAWIYPSQRDGWTPVSLNKMGSWYLLMLLSFVLVTAVNRPRPYGTFEHSNGKL